jgi:hypothetical protein
MLYGATLLRAFAFGIRFALASPCFTHIFCECLMVNEISRGGLIVAPAVRRNPLVAELIELCNWPLVVEPTARLLFQQIDISRPLCLVFWLDADQDLEALARLVARLRDRGPRPYRVAIAHRLEGVEPKFRAAGVHSFLSTSGSLASLVEEALLPLLDAQRAHVHADQEVAEVPVAIRGPTNVRGSPAPMRPP